MSRRRKWFILWIVIPIILVGTLTLLSANYFLDPNIYRNILQKSLTTALDRDVSIGKARINLWGGVGIAFEDFRVRDRSLAFDLLQSRRLILRLRILPLLKREIKWKRIVVDRPTLHVIRDRNWSAQCLLRQSFGRCKTEGNTREDLGDPRLSCRSFFNPPRRCDLFLR